MKRLLAIISCGLFAASLSLGQKPETATPTTKPAPADSLVPADPADTKKAPEALAAEVKSALPVLTVEQILKKNRAATGSSFTEAKVTSMLATGTFELPAMGAQGALEIYGKAPNKQLTVINIPGFGEAFEGFDGTEAWARDPISGLRVKTGVELAQAKSAAIFDRDSMLEKLYPKMEAKGTEKVGGRDAYVVVATSSDAGVETWYFDGETFLLIRQDVVAEGPQGKLPLQNYFEDFRVVSGVKMPFVTRITNPSYNATIRLTEIKTNVAIDDAKFAKPMPAAKPAPAATTPAAKPAP